MLNGGRPAPDHQTILRAIRYQISAGILSTGGFVAFEDLKLVFARHHCPEDIDVANLGCYSWPSLRRATRATGRFIQRNTIRKDFMGRGRWFVWQAQPCQRGNIAPGDWD